MIKLIISEEFGKAFIPKRFRQNIRAYFLKAGIDDVPYKFFGILFYVSVLVVGMIYIFLFFPILGRMNVNIIVFLLSTFTLWTVFQLAFMLLSGLSIYAYLDLKIYNRKKKIEEVLQEFLRYVSENLKGGMSIENALWDAIRPKFGILAHEIRLAAKRVMTGQDVEEALLEFTEKYDSPMLKRSFDLIIEGMKGGAELAELIDRIQINLRETRELKNEISATNSTYVIFLTVIALIISPLLFGLSHNLLVILKNMTSTLWENSASSGKLPFRIGTFSLDPDTFFHFSIYMMIITSSCTALISSIIRNGNFKDGVKYVPLYVLGSVFAYLFFKTFFFKIFSGLTTLV